MAFCSKCGAQVADNVAFCGKCGQAVGEPVATTQAPAASTQGDTGMAENVAGLLCYSLWWVTGLIFFLIDKRPSVRFHAAQSMVVFGGLQVIYILFVQIFYSGFLYGGLGFFSLSGLLFVAIRLAAFALWIFLMVKAYQGERFKVPVAGGIAESIAGK
jgi:uncharacterized membrane protein